MNVSTAVSERRVLFGGVPAETVSVNTEVRSYGPGCGTYVLTDLVVRTPAGEPGTTVSVTLEGVNGPTQSYTYESDPTPTPSGPVEELPIYDFAASGAAKLQTLTRGDVGVSGLLSARLDLETGAFTAKLSLDDTSATLKAFGFLPIRTALSFEGAPLDAAGNDTLGTVQGPRVEARTSQDITIRSATLFGIPLVFDPRCGTKTPSQIALASTDEFSALRGGQLAGTFGISDLEDCGFLTFLISPLTAGEGNELVLNLAPAS